MYRLEQAQTEQSIANSLANQNRLAEALAPFTRASNLLEAVVRSHPDDLSNRSLLGAAQNDLGMALAALGRQKEAAEAYDRAIENQRIAHERAPEVPQYVQFLGNHFTNRGMLQEQLGDNKAASESYRLSLELREALVLRSPEGRFLSRHAGRSARAHRHDRAQGREAGGCARATGEGP